MNIREGIRPVPNLLKALCKAQRGSVAPMIAVLAPMLVGAAGFALDAAAYYVGSRDLRVATEAAALAASQNPLQAEMRARTYLELNGYSADVLKSVEVGRYCQDIDINSAARFDPSYTLCPGDLRTNAVRIKTETESRQYLTKVLGPFNPIPAISASAAAARIDEAGIGVTAGILTVTNSLVTSVNELLGAIVGVKLHLSTSDVEALLGGNVDASLFFDNLAESVGENGTYSDLVRRSVPLDALLRSAAAATDAQTANALNLAAQQVGGAYQVSLAGLFDLGVWAKTPVGYAEVQSNLRAGLNAYQLLAYAVQSGNGSIDLSDAVSLAVPGSTVRLAGMATGPFDRARFAFGPAGETLAGTSALRLQLLIGVGDVSVLGNTLTVNSIPVLVDVGAATAETISIDCTNSDEQARDTRVTVRATSGLVNAYIGEAPANAMTSPMPLVSASDIQQARIVSVASLLTVEARAIAQPVFGTSSDLVFGPGGQGTIGTPPLSGQPASAGNGSQVGPLISSLSNSLMASNGIQVKVLGLCLPLVCDAMAQNVRSQIVGGATGALGGLVGATADPLLDNVLSALGVQLGHVTVWATGARCGVPVLI